MVSPINNSGNSAYGIGGFPTKGNGNEVAEKETQQENNGAVNQQTQVNPDDVFAFLANNGIYVPVVSDVNNDGVVNQLDFDADPEMQARMDEFMAKFDVVYKLIADEFGEELAPRLVDMVMDKVMGF